MVCVFCKKREGFSFTYNDSWCFDRLMEAMAGIREHHSEMQNECQRLSQDKERLAQENESLRNQVEILQTVERYREKYPETQKKSQPEPEPETQPIFPDEEDEKHSGDPWDVAFLASPDVLDKENTPKRTPLSPLKSNLFDDESTFLEKLPQRSKVANRTSTSKWFTSGTSLESLTSYKSSPKPRLSKLSPKKKPKLIQTTLNYSRVDRDETFCEELTPDDRITKRQLADTPPKTRPSRPSLQLENTEVHPEDTIFIDDDPAEKPLQSFHTPDGFWNLGFPPTAKTQVASPSDRMQKRPRRKT